MHPSISIFIICQNEERIIGACLEQASKLAQEIIVVDSGSTDDTLKIAKKFTDRIYHQKWLGYGPQKNFALGLCRSDWVLSLDADEILSDSLISEIQSLDFKALGYQVSRKLFIDDRWVRYGGFYPDYQLRLFRRSSGKFCDSQVHESVELYNPIRKIYHKNRDHCPKLKNSLNHYAYSSLEDMQKTFQRYAKLNFKSKNIFYALINFSYTFILKFFFRLGFLNGMLGFRLALISAQYSYGKYCSTRQRDPLAQCSER